MHQNAYDIVAVKKPQLHVKSTANRSFFQVMAVCFQASLLLIVLNNQFGLLTFFSANLMPPGIRVSPSGLAFW